MEKRRYRGVIPDRSKRFPSSPEFQICSHAHRAPVALSARVNLSEREDNHSLQFGADFKNNLKESSASPCPIMARGGAPLPHKTTSRCKENFTPHKLQQVLVEFDNTAAASCKPDT